MATVEEMKKKVAKLKAKAEKEFAAMTDEQKKQLEETSRLFARKCEMPQDAQISSK